MIFSMLGAKWRPVWQHAVRAFSLIAVLVLEVGTALLPAQAATPNLTPQPPITAPASIAELARALNNDANLIYEYVYTNIEFIPTWGAKKGALGTLLDGRGNAFDQSALLVALLRQAGYTANFVAGTIRFNQAQVNAWLGIDSSGTCNVFNVLRPGGVPFLLYTSTGTCAGTFSYVDIGHVWVSVTGGSFGSATYVYDPSYKTYTTLQAGIDLASVLGYNQSSFISQVQSGSTITSNSIQNLNRTNLQNRLGEYAANLVDYIRSNMPAATLNDVVGGKYIQPLSQPFTPYVALPYQVGTPTSWAAIPNAYRTTLNMQIGGIDLTFYSDEIYGHRLSIVYDSSNRPVFYLDGVSQATGTANAATITYNATFPFCWQTSGTPSAACGAGYTNIFSFQNIIRAVSGYTYAIVGGWDPTGRGMVEFHRRQLQQKKAEGMADGSEAVLGDTLNMIGASFLAQFSGTFRLIDRIIGSSTAFHCLVGVVGQTTGPYIDIPGVAGSIGSLTSDSNRYYTAFYTSFGHASAFEWGTLEQDLSLVGIGAVSTVNLLDLANAQGVVVYDANPSNWATIRAQLQGYAAGDLSTLDSYINQGYRLILPKQGNLTQGQWIGVGYILANPAGSSGATLGYLVSSNFKGGYPTNSVTPSELVPAVELTAMNLNDAAGQNQTSFEPIDLVAGAYLHDHVDLSIGSAAFPYGLGFQRSYSSANRYRSGPLGLGWTHNHAVTARRNSDGFKGLGQDSPIDAAAAIAEIYVAQDLLSDASKPLNKMMIATLAQRWFMDRLIDNAVNVASGPNTTQFMLLADGTFNQPMASSDRLTLSGGRYTVTKKDGVTLSFTSDGNIESWQSPSGVTVSYGYDANAPPRLVSVSNSLGRALTLQYDGSSRLIAVNDNASPARQVGYAYDSAGDLTGFTDAASNTTAYSYTPPGGSLTPGLMTQIFPPWLPSGVALVTNTYDSLGRVAAQANANNAPGFDTTWEYRFAGYRSEEIDPFGVRHVLYLNPRGKTLFDIRDAAGAAPTTKNTYDGRDRLTATTNPEGDGIAIAYDAAVNPWADNVATITRAAKPGSGLDPLVTTFTYDPLWNKHRTVTDPRGVVTRNFHDPSTGNLVGSVADDGGVNAARTFTYDSRGLPLTATDPMGVVSRNTYDSFGNLIQAVADDGGLNQTSRFTYDGVGNLIAATDPNGNTTTFTWDALRRRLTQTAPSPFNVGASLVRTSWTYDADGKVTQVSRSNGATPQVVQTTYTNSGKVATVTDPNSHVASFAYDRADRLASRTDPLNRTTSYTYDALGRLATVVDPLGNTAETRAYTANGLLQSLTDANGNLTRSEYDGFDRLEYTRHAYGTALQSSERFAYDANSNVTTRWTRAGAAIAFAYDNLNRLITKTPPSPAPVVSYRYDLAGRLIGVSDTSAAIASVSGTAASYSTTTEYDALDQEKVIAFDPAPAQTPPGGAATVTFTHGYDATDRRTSQTVLDDTWMLKPSGTATTSYTANALNQYTAVGAASPSYDADGNLTGDGTFTYTYDAENRLTGVSGAGVTAAYAYDARGRRKSRTVGSTSTIYLTDPADREVLEYDGTTGAVLAWTAFGPGPDAVLARMDVAGGVRTTEMTDVQGSVVGELSSGGALAKTGYLPYAENTAPPAPGPRYTGRILDPETAGGASQPSGLYYYRARTYSPTLGRFMQPDPIGVAGGINLYAYVGNDPLNATDPSGLFLDAILDVGFIAYDIGMLAYDEAARGGANRTANLIALGADVAGLAVPFVTGAGQAYRAGNTLVNVARQADAAVPLGGSASVRGTAVHKQFNDALIGGAGGRYVAPETAYIAGARSDLYRPAGSVNPDAVVGNINSPAAVFDLKTGASSISPNQLSRYESNLPTGTSVYELRTTGHTAPRPQTYTGIGAIGNTAYQAYK